MYFPYIEIFPILGDGTLRNIQTPQGESDLAKCQHPHLPDVKSKIIHPLPEFWAVFNQVLVGKIHINVHDMKWYLWRWNDDMSWNAETIHIRNMVVV